MSGFIKRILLLLLFAVVVMTVLDIGYTYVYAHAKPRSKVQLVMNAPPQHYDAIVLGSSRAANHVVTELFAKRGVKAYNMGMSGSTLCENGLMLKLFFERGNTADKVLLQLDVNFRGVGSAPGIKALFMPYLMSNETVYRHYLKYDKASTVAYRYVPFYRYCSFDSKIGVRELTMSLFGKRGKDIENGGFIPLKGVLESKDKFVMDKEVRKKNSDYDDIVATCRLNHVPLVSFTAPFCAYIVNADYFLKLKKVVPDLYDYSGVVKADSLFATCGHMNEKGARVFTEYLLKEQFPGKRQ